MSPSEKIARHVLLSFPDVTWEDIIGKPRSMRVVGVRWIIMHRLWVDLGLTTTQIGRRLGRDHSTVVHGLHVSHEWLQHCLAQPRREASRVHSRTPHLQQIKRLRRGPRHSFAKAA